MEEKSKKLKEILESMGATNVKVEDMYIHFEFKDEIVSIFSDDVTIMDKEWRDLFPYKIPDYSNYKTIRIDL
jgi:uncharacterized protein (DUF1499 family)